MTELKPQVDGDFCGFQIYLYYILCYISYHIVLYYDIECHTILYIYNITQHYWRTESKAFFGTSAPYICCMGSPEAWTTVYPEVL